MVIDIHAHYIPQNLIAMVRSRSADLGMAADQAGSGPPALRFEYGFKVRPFFPQLVETADARRSWLDAKGIDRQIVATWPDIYGYGLPVEKSVAWHGALNDTLAEWCTSNADRFSWLASVPMSDADAAAELERAHKLGAVGVMVAANVEGTNLGEIALERFWRQAESLKMPVVVHPVMVKPEPRAGKFALAQIVYYTADTTYATGSLIFAGILDRFPELTVVLSHGGGCFPYLIGRFDLMHNRMDRAAQADVASAMPSAYARRMAYDTIVHAPHVLRFLADSVGMDRLALGTDYSFPPADLDPLRTLNDAGLSRDDIAMVTDRNPRRLFPRLP